MGIRIENPTSQPAVVFDRVHLTRLAIEQPMFDDDAAQPVYRVSIEYRLFGTDEHGWRHYAPVTHEVELPDYLADAIVAAQSGDMALLGALQGIEAAVAAIITERAGQPAAVV